jgi:GNAT superfamily N-acetyltransferase
MTDLQRVLEAAPSYSHRITGLPPGDRARTYAELPPGKTHEDKFVFGIWHGGTMVGVVDVVRGYPTADIAYLGLLVLAEEYQRRGHGRAAYHLVEDVVRCWGCSRVRLSVVRANAEVIPFWLGLGFRATGEVKPYRYAAVISEHVLFEKAL